MPSTEGDQIDPSEKTEVESGSNNYLDSQEIEDPKKELPPEVETGYSTHAEAVDAISTEQIRDALREWITPESLKSLTRRILRTKLEEKFELPERSTETRKKEINDLVREVMDSIMLQEQPRSPDPPRRQKRKLSTMEEAAGSDNEEETSESGDETGKRGDDTRKKARKGSKKGQATIMTKSHFCDHALPLVSNLGPLQFTATPREFSTGSCGWFYGSKHELPVGDEKVMCQLTINCAVLGSKSWKEGKPKS
eukprot:Gregarina_sp_Poly_1__9178@NODE_564_length_7515_cov_115_964823_g443_i0_p4_GENE_NODE_564_length_7515_cov_115_964823_g443_i0NODE_564_length_7515_cov_115_964823_g443_i0_p4_ORF_typecomplete_len252_score45_70DEK_C/PF08766_11/1_2e05CobT/PF06213_12/0_19DUF3006/PF11213_8/49DUF3006/PF11213_8/22TMEM119/PF15724_5/1_5e03TMEM119/PF15724_5/0_26_NODE_564_length_7515_cov_115_964823_g443_i053316086